MDRARKKRVSMKVPVQKVVDLSSTWDEHGGVFTQAPVRLSSQSTKVKEYDGELQFVSYMILSFSYQFFLFFLMLFVIDVKPNIMFILSYFWFIFEFECWYCFKLLFLL
jgi:hypothetical protein